MTTEIERLQHEVRQVFTAAERELDEEIERLLAVAGAGRRRSSRKVARQVVAAMERVGAAAIGRARPVADRRSPIQRSRLARLEAEGMDGLVGLAQGRLTSAGLAERHWRTRLAEARERVLRPSPRPRKAGAALWARLTPAAKWALGVATAVAGAVIADLIFGFLSR